MEFDITTSLSLFNVQGSVSHIANILGPVRLVVLCIKGAVMCDLVWRSRIL